MVGFQFKRLEEAQEEKDRNLKKNFFVIKLTKIAWSQKHESRQLEYPLLSEQVLFYLVSFVSFFNLILGTSVTFKQDTISSLTYTIPQIPQHTIVAFPIKKLRALGF